jgi:hypothetical protein
MKQIQQHQRCAADQEFQQSLVQLQDILQANSTQNQVSKKVDTSSSINENIGKSTDTIDLDDLEDAVADIEQYLAKKQKN